MKIQTLLFLYEASGNVAFGDKLSNTMKKALLSDQEVGPYVCKHTKDGRGTKESRIA